MGDVTVALLEGKQRVAEDVFGWNRRAIEVGIHEYQTGITCINDIATRVKPKTEDKQPKLLAEIHSIMEPHSESESSLRTTLLYTSMTAKTVHEALVQKGWSPQSLPSVRTISNLLHRQDYRLRTIASLVDGVYEKGVKIRGSENLALSSYAVCHLIKCAILELGWLECLSVSRSSYFLPSGKQEAPPQRKNETHVHPPD